MFEIQACDLAWQIHIQRCDADFRVKTVFSQKGSQKAGGDDWSAATVMHEWRVMNARLEDGTRALQRQKAADLP